MEQTFQFSPCCFRQEGCRRERQKRNFPLEASRGGGGGGGNFAGGNPHSGGRSRTAIGNWRSRSFAPFNPTLSLEFQKGCCVWVAIIKSREKSSHKSSRGSCSSFHTNRAATWFRWRSNTAGKERAQVMTCTPVKNLTGLNKIQSATPFLKPASKAARQVPPANLDVTQQLPQIVEACKTTAYDWLKHARSWTALQSVTDG